MKTRLAALVAPDMVELTRKSAGTITEMSIITDVFYHPKDAIALYEEYIDQSDVLLFGGPLAYLFVQDHIRRTGVTVNKPMLHVPYTEVSIYRALFAMSKDVAAKLRSPTMLSVDFPAESDIRECLEELEINSGQAFMKECSIDYDFDELVAFHYELWKQGRAQVAMSSVYLVYKRLQDQEIAVLQEVERALGVEAGLGIGFGHTAHEAERKAYEAASKARAAGNGSCFVVEMNGMVTRLLGDRPQLKYSARSDSPELLLAAKKAGLSVSTINKLVAFIDSSGKTRFTAFDLACGFDITFRSARRILGKLEGSGFVVPSGEEQPVSRGRPRRMYTLSEQK